MENGIKRTHPNLAAFTKHPHLAARTMTGGSRMAGRKVGGKLRPDLRSRSARAKARVLTPTGRPGSQFCREQIPLRNPGTPTPARASAGGGTAATPGRVSSDSGPRSRRATLGGDFSDATRQFPEPRLAAGGAQGGGARRRAHSTPAAGSPHKVGFVLGPCPLAPRERQRSPQRG